MKKIYCLLFLLPLFLSANDLLSKASNGALSGKMPLSSDELASVKGGVIFFREPTLDLHVQKNIPGAKVWLNTGSFYITRDKNGEITTNQATDKVRQQFGVPGKDNVIVGFVDRYNRAYLGYVNTVTKQYGWVNMNPDSIFQKRFLQSELSQFRLVIGAYRFAH